MRLEICTAELNWHRNPSHSLQLSEQLHSHCVLGPLLGATHRTRGSECSQYRIPRHRGHGTGLSHKDPFAVEAVARQVCSPSRSKSKA
jgi:hypothetical protein